MVQPDRPEMTL